ncbi:MAG: right-handed parallel beta-helix repeat-containing protein [Bacteroidales bacterium]|nr:right-handed parallel beta-helix repeat-containing protein [Bacteroidales bacterium]
MAGYANNVTIEHNEIWDCPYTGIAVGWAGASDTCTMGQNIIRNNHIYQVSKLLCGGAGILVQEKQPGTHILENHIHDIQLTQTAFGNKNSGICLDNNADGVTLEMNWMEKIMNDPIYNIEKKSTVQVTLIKNELWPRRFPEDHSRVVNNAGPKSEYQSITKYLKL